ncbi:MAG TPA: hypothetical protein VJS92_17865 [Candidatus Polarisedimenticolaceae bacterium]|nr:hypothetical protein [Candidatus Polarisedimenticolaceae bacterium]
MHTRRATRSLAPEGGEAVARHEFWPPWLFYLPVAAYYAWLALRFRGLLLPTCANPTIFSGGLLGESKSAILDLVPVPWRERLARYAVVDRGERGTPEAAALERARRALHHAGLDYPLVAKPDVGQRGAGIAPLYGEDDLVNYLRRFPAGARLLLQEMADGKRRPGGVREAGIMYWRAPDAAHGRIFSLTLKRTPWIVGDGVRSVRELILGDRRARRLKHVYLPRHATILEQVLDPGVELPLVFAGNHCQGTIFCDGTDLVTPELADCIDALARAIPGFHFGRFDVCFAELGALLRGQEFQIIEINGAGAEATHIWDGSVTLREAYGTLFEQFRALFVIGAANRRRGHPPLGSMTFLRTALAYRRLAAGYPPSR